MNLFYFLFLELKKNKISSNYFIISNEIKMRHFSLATLLIVVFILSFHSFVSSSPLPPLNYGDYNNADLTNYLHLLAESMNSVLFEKNANKEDDVYDNLGFVRVDLSQPSSSHIVRRLKVKLMEPLKRMHTISSRLR